MSVPIYYVILPDGREFAEETSQEERSRGYGSPLQDFIDLTVRNSGLTTGRKSVVFIGTPETGRSPADGIPTVDRRGPVRVDRQAMFTAAVNAMLAGVKPPSPPTGETPAIMPATPPKHYPALVGRNDRCPCGSGRKYKKCHTGRAITDRIET